MRARTKRHGRHIFRAAYPRLSTLKRDGMRIEGNFISIHGMGVGSLSLIRQLGFFKEKRFYSYTPDLPGHGDHQERKTTIHFEHYVEYVLQFIEKVMHLHPDLPTFILGHSMGGLIVQQCLERVTHPLAGAILVTPAIPREIAGFSPFSTKKILRFMNLEMMQSVFNLGLGVLLGGEVRVGKALAQQILVDPKKRLSRFVEKVGWESPHVFWDLIFRRISVAPQKTRTPTLVIGAGKDILVPHEACAEFARLIQAEFRLFEDAGHLCLVEEPAHREVLPFIHRWTQEVLKKT